MMIFPGKAQAALPPAYQLGLSQADVNKLTIPPTGIPDDTGEEYAVDYRRIQAPSRATKEEKPTAQFEVLANGQAIGQSDPGRDLDAPTAVIDINLNDTITLRDISRAYPGNKLCTWDLQYRILPVPEEDIADIDAYRSQFTIKALVDFRSELSVSGEGINTYFQEALQEMKDTYPEQDCYIELYLEVADKDKMTGQEGWSDNGTYAYHKTKAMGSPYTKGHIWYFSAALLRVNAKGVPDFFPTPEGSDRWQESFKTCAKTYIGTPGETVNINFSLHNAGDKQTTDFAAAWFGSGWNDPIWKVDNITLDKGEKQDFNLSVKVPEPGQETRLVFLANLDGKTPAAESNQENNIMIIRITSNVNLSAVSIKAGASPPVTGGHYNGTVTFKNNSNVTLYNVPIAVFNNGYRTTLRDIFWTPVTQADFGPGETKQFTFQWTLCEYSKLEGVINVEPLTTVYPEDNYKDNKVMTVVSAPMSGTGQQELTFQAWRQWSFIDVMGEPREYRKPNTARYTDIVETTLTPTNIKKVKYTVSQGESVDYTNTIAPPVPTCGDSCGAWNTMTGWEITKATLHYPEKSEGFTFGHPFWDNDWTYKSMKPQGKVAKEKIKEEWAMDGAPVFDRTINDFVGPPKHYTLRANYTVKVTYDQTCGYLVCETDDEGNTTCWCEYETTKGLTAIYNYTGTGKILIDGTGAAPVPTQHVEEFKNVFPHLVEVPY
ncbi:COG1470 family protein [Syntrophomonas curvata]